MFYYVKGTVAHVAPFLAVIDCGGVGYACRTTNTTLSRLEKGAPATLYTHLNVREDAMELYGFYSENELNCFRMLIGVSGVGPKAALSILSATTPEGLAMSIITGDEKSLTVAQGIGRTHPVRPPPRWPCWATDRTRSPPPSRAWTWSSSSWRRSSSTP